MKTIYKFQLKLQDNIRIDMPAGAELLSVSSGLSETAYLWALVETDSRHVERTIRCAGTGHPIESWFTKDRFIGTIILGYTGLVFHFFDGGEQ